MLRIAVAQTDGVFLAVRMGHLRVVAGLGQQGRIARALGGRVEVDAKGAELVVAQPVEAAQGQLMLGRKRVLERSAGKQLEVLVVKALVAYFLPAQRARMLAPQAYLPGGALVGLLLVEVTRPNSFGVTKLVGLIGTQY